MTESPQQAARRLAAGPIRDGFKPQALHEYTGPARNPLHWRIRLKHPESGDKWIRPMKLNGEGYTLGEPEYPDGKPLYRLHELAARPADAVIVCEGEWCVDALAKIGMLATTSGAADSAGKADWRPIAGRRVTVWADNDEAGSRYAEEVAEALLPLGCAVRLVDVAALNLQPKGDAVDWLAAHPNATAEDVASLPTVDLPATRERGATGFTRHGGLEAVQRTVANARPPDPDADQGPAAAGSIAFRRLSEIRARPVNWLWPGRIARGKVSMLAGNPGLGKSQITASMAAVVTRGGLWPVDRSRCEIGNVVFLSAEDDPEDTIRPRLEAAGADISRVWVLDAVVEGFASDGQELRRSFNLKTDLSRLGSLLETIGDVALIIIDPISAYLGGTDSHVNAEVRALLSPLGDLAAEHSAAVVCVSHLNKGGGGEALMRVTGSLAFVAAARAVFVVTRDPENDARRLLLPMKNNIGKDRDGLAFAVDSARIDSPAGPIETSCVLISEKPQQPAACARSTAERPRGRRAGAAGWSSC